MPAPGVQKGVPDRGAALTGVIWPLLGIALLTAVLRGSIRVKYRMFGWDDAFMVLATLSFVAWSICLTFYAEHGGLQHIHDLERSGSDNVSLVLFLNWLSQVFGIMGIAFGKISVAALLLSIINKTELRRQKWFLWSVTIVLALAFAVSCCILSLAQCVPVRALWDERVDGKCIDPKIISNYSIFLGSFNTFADASLAIIPGTIFWGLNNSASAKAQLTIVFGLNLLTASCSGVKTQYLVALANRRDQTWATYDIFVWVTGELFLMIVCSAIPTLKPVLRFLKATFGFTGSSASHSHRAAAKLPSKAREHQMDVVMQRPAKALLASETIGAGGSSDQLVGDAKQGSMANFGAAYQAKQHY